MEKSIEKKLIQMVKRTYCRIRPSKIHGIGVFAIRNIPQYTDVFYGVHKHEEHKIKMSAFKKTDREVKRMLKDFFIFDAADHVILPDYGLNGMDISFFLNTSKRPNVKTLDGGETFVAIRKIKKGEELTVDYDTYYV